MAVLNIRNLPSETHARLRVRAAERGRSMEAEARAILEEAVAREPTETPPPAAMQEWFSALGAVAGSHGLADELIADRRAEAKREPGQ